MQLLIKHHVQDNLILPLSYHHILQSIIYQNMDDSFGFRGYMHENGFQTDTRSFKLFTFSLLNGKYRIKGTNILFYDEVSFEIRSPDMFLLKMLAKNITRNGIRYGNQHYNNVEVEFADHTIEDKLIAIRMLSPVTVHTTNPEDKKTVFYTPQQEEFCKLINDNFLRKYYAYSGIVPESNVLIRPLNISPRDKYVTTYKDFYINAWRGEYLLSGERKYLDFLYHTGIGSRNAQGFGMFQVI